MTEEIINHIPISLITDYIGKNNYIYIGTLNIKIHNKWNNLKSTSLESINSYSRLIELDNDEFKNIKKYNNLFRYLYISFYKLDIKLCFTILNNFFEGVFNRFIYGLLLNYF